MSDKNIIICIDGTGNDPMDEHITNVLKFHQAIDVSEHGNQQSFYFAGVGNEVEHNKFVQAKGSIFGYGAEKIKDEAYAKLGFVFTPGDKIFIFGFSRGAAIARELAVQIGERGINGYRTKIEMLGVWDTVASFGIPIDVGPLHFQEINLFKDFSPEAYIKKAYHLLAVDEQRTPFKPTLMISGKNVEEIWFAGTHSNVGGGAADPRLSDITLRFMINRAKEQDVDFVQTAEEQLKPDIRGTLNETKLDKIVPLESRTIEVLTKRPGQKEPAPSPSPPKIHHTVFERMKIEELNYNPENVNQLGGNYMIINLN